MKSAISKLFLSAGIAVTLGACASATTLPGENALAQIKPGQTREQVRALVGNPSSTFDYPRADESVWAYTFTDSWGYRSEFDVEFDQNGVVEGITTARKRY